MDKRYKIGIFIDTFYPMVDGVIVTINSIAALLNKIADVTVFTVAPKNGVYDDSGLDYKVVRCRSVKLPLIKLDYDLPVPRTDREFLKKLEESQLDLVHIHSPFGLGKAGLRYARRHKIPVVMTLHSQYKRDFYKHTHSKILTALCMKIIMRVLNGCDECWSVNEASKEILREYGVKNGSGVIMENGTDMLPVASREKAAADVGALCGIKEGQKVFLYTGRIVALKNVFFIADALKVLKERGIDFKMIFIGGGADKESLSERLAGSGLSDNVYFAGYIYDRALLADFYAAADLFLFPSFYDTDGVVKKEAACQSTPIVCVEGSIVARTVDKDRNAYISANDPAAYAEEIVNALTDPEKYRAIAENAHNEIYVTWAQTAQRTYDRYKTLIERGEKLKVSKAKVPLLP